MNLIALHGFLGSAKDFGDVTKKINPKELWIPDLFGKDKDFLSGDFNQWTTQALSYIEGRFHGEPADLIGYSMGGRLALHLVMRNPERFNRVILLSTHPGLFDTEEIIKRHSWERMWLEKLESLPMDQFIKEWLAQPLFSDDERRTLNTDAFDRLTLQRSFEMFSNTKHQFAPGDLEDLRKNLIWVFGERDQKFLKIKSELETLRGSKDRFLVIPQAGHRLVAGKDLTWLYTLFS